GRGGCVGTAPQVVEEVGSVAVVGGGEGQGVEVVADAEAVGDGTVGVDGAEGGEAVVVVAQVVEEVGSVAVVAGGEGQGVEVVADAEAVGDGAAGSDGAEGGKAGTDEWHFQDLLFGIRLVRHRRRSRQNYAGDHRRVR